MLFDVGIVCINIIYLHIFDGFDLVRKENIENIFNDKKEMKANMSWSFSGRSPLVKAKLI